MRKLGPWLAVAAVVVAADQATKALVQASLAPGERIPVIPFADLVLVFNTGAAFSFLAGAGGWQRVFFIVIAVGAIALIGWLLARHAGERLFCAGLALILGGAIGNLWDRIALGHVVDFVLLHAGRLAFPGVQRRRLRDHRRRGGADPGWTAGEGGREKGEGGRVESRP